VIERELEEMSSKETSGFFGEYGGRFVPENLVAVLEEVKQAFYQYKNDPDFIKELDYYLKYFVGRANPLYFAERLTREAGRQDLFKTGGSQPHGRP
jgi:tryptophan synthase beta chain